LGPNRPREKWPCRCLATGGMDSSLAGLGAARGWRRSGRFIASACATMLIVAAGSRFPEANPLDGNSDAIAIWGTAAAAPGALDRVAGMIKKTVYRSSGRRVRGEDDKIPAIKTAAPDLPLDVLRNMDIRVDSWSAPPLCSANALRISRRMRTLAHQLYSWRKRAAHARTSGAHVSRNDAPSNEQLGPCPLPPDRHARSHRQHRLLHLLVRRVRVTAQRSPSSRTSGTSRRRTESASWFEKQALAGTCPNKGTGPAQRYRGLGSGTLRCQNGGETCRDRSVLSRSTRPGIHSRNPVNSRVHLTAGAVLGVITYPLSRGLGVDADSETYHWCLDHTTMGFLV
jgi:hypothetical protein